MFSLWLTNERRTREKNIVCISVYSLTIVLLKTVGKGDKILQNAVKWSTYGLFKVATLFYYYKNIVEKYRCEHFYLFFQIGGHPTESFSFAQLSHVLPQLFDHLHMQGSWGALQSSADVRRSTQHFFKDKGLLFYS